MASSRDPDETLRAASPALWAALSPLGRRLRMPANFLPQQTAEARGKRFNATIGQITDGHGTAVPLPSVAAALAGLPEAERSRALLYSPVEGLLPLRERWRERQRRGQPEGRPSSLPLATGGVRHALSLAAQLFAEGAEDVRDVFLPDPPPDDSYAETLGLRTGARLAGVPGLTTTAFDPAPLRAGLDALPAGRPAVVALRLPEASGERSLKPGERAALAAALAAAAERQPVVVLVDDLWESFSPEGRSGSLFWDLVDLHPALLPLKADGAEALGYPGGRIGFLTLPFPPGSAAAVEVESKVKLLLRAEIGSPSAASQVVLLAALQSEA
jgi:hypothetical protein